MLKKLDAFFEKIKSRKLFLTIALIGWFSDISNMIYIQKYLLPKYLTTSQITKMLTLQGFDPSIVDPEAMTQMKLLMISTFGTMMMAFAIAHTIFYILVYKRKRGMMKYVKNYSFTAFILTILTAPTFLDSSLGIFLFLLLTTVAYFFNYRALKFLLNKKRLVKGVMQ